MSAERNTAREWRRALARQNALANEIAAACASGRVPDRRLVAEWSLASMRSFAREKHLRPRECGAPLGEGNNQAAPLRRESRPVDRDAGRGPESGISSNNPNTTNHERNTEPDTLRRLHRPLPMPQGRLRLPHAGTVGGLQR